MDAAVEIRRALHTAANSAGIFKRDAVAAFGRLRVIPRNAAGHVVSRVLSVSINLFRLGSRF